MYNFYQNFCSFLLVNIQVRESPYDKSHLFCSSFFTLLTAKICAEIMQSVRLFPLIIIAILLLRNCNCYDKVALVFNTFGICKCARAHILHSCFIDFITHSELNSHKALKFVRHFSALVMLLMVQVHIMIRTQTTKRNHPAKHQVKI